MSRTVDFLARLVAFPTISRQTNLPLLDWVEGELAATGARIRRLPGDAPGRGSLLATIGPERDDGIVLSAHSDVVPVAGQDWTSDPFVLTERDGRLYGRGSSDMKGFLACMLTAAHDAARRPALARPLHLAVSYDEEIGCVGVRALLRQLRDDGFRAAGCVVGEPTDLHVAVGHKGKVAATITCTGRAAHSANPWLGQNAILMAADMVRAIEALQRDVERDGARADGYAVPFGTVQVGIIQGGTALNIVPDRCQVAFEMRLLPGDDPAPYLERLRRAAAGVVADRAPLSGPGGEIAIAVDNAYPGLVPDTASEICALGLAAAGRNEVVSVGFGTEAGLFQEQLGLPCIICGPGSIDRAHKPDEYVTRAELAEGDRFLARVIDALAG
ncbi:acetylornithine deacetylase ArgE [Gluconacetobacter johannae DSM 13595]|uniref:Acetylornithine deacetylase n=1 Tax=Gluconacetobacter johannae TaxID=112140 RepID=A0A7W4J6T1_9PROT|nr:acetylornithine deacetylase [Gluconacetobacter johannae]MBB2175487.1 acetylornithine deacetylase [Gluconacetobacter johannae]GBQ89069.1 acetylornithine deacetylase ArgE [Gluconacetobacter johannae DSM 13595]